jgi:hypothetical protein
MSLVDPRRFDATTDFLLVSSMNRTSNVQWEDKRPFYIRNGRLCFNDFLKASRDFFERRPSRDFKGLHGTSRDFKGLQGTSRDFKGLQGTSMDFKGLFKRLFKGL